MMNYRLFITGEIFHDFGLLQLYTYLKTLTTAKLESNYIEFPDFDANRLFDLIFDDLKLLKPSEENVKENENSEKKLKLINFPYIRNSFKFGYNIPDKKNMQNGFNENLKKLIGIFKQEIQGEYNPIYEYDALCNNCYRHRAPKKEQDPPRNRIISNAMYPLTGEENSDRSNYCKGDINICFSCEFIALLSLVKYISTGKDNSIFYSRDLKFNFNFNKIMRSKKKILSEPNKLKNLLIYGKAHIKEFEFKFEGGLFNLVYLGSHNIQKLIDFLYLKRIIQNFRFGRGISENIIFKEIKQGNLGLVKGILLSRIVFSDDNGFNEKETQNNLHNYLEFIKISGGKKMGATENNDTQFKAFYISGKKLRAEMDSEKAKKLTLKLIQLLQGNDRTTLLEEIIRALILNQVEIPAFASDTIIRSSEDDLHLSVGSFIEGLNSTEKTN